MKRLLASLLLSACSNNPDPRLIAGGGIGDGDIDGTLHVYVIDQDTKAVVSGAMVAVGTAGAVATDATGLVTVTGVSGPQSVAVTASGYRDTAWLHANGANVTIPITKTTQTADSATLHGTITGWDTITVPLGHAKVALVTFSQSDTLGDASNNLSTPASGNICLGPTCNWSLVSRTGTLSLIAIILDRDAHGTADPTDDTSTILGWAKLTPVTVAKGVDQSGLALAMVETGNLGNVTIDFGTPPAGLPMTQAIVGIELANDEVVQLPTFAQTDQHTVLVPKPSVFSADATYRLTAVAQTTSAMTAQSVVLRHKLSGPALAAGEWLVPPANITATRTAITFDRVTDAKAHNVTFADGNGTVRTELTTFDPAATSIEVPPTFTLPSGTLSAKVGGIAADFSVTDFSLQDDKDQLWGIATQPETIP